MMGVEAKKRLREADNHAEAFEAEAFPAKKQGKAPVAQVQVSMKVFYSMFEGVGDGKWKLREDYATKYGLSLAEPLSNTKAMEFAASVGGTTRPTLKRSRDAWENNREKKGEDVGRRGAAAPAHPYHVDKKARDALGNAIKKFVANEQKTSSAPVTFMLVREAMSRRFQFPITRRVVRAVMKKHKVVYEKMLSLSREDLVRKHTWNRIFFLPTMAVAIKEEKKGKAVIINFDQSFCHTSHGSNYGYVNKENPRSLAVSKSKGHLLCISHAVSKFGMVAAYSEDGKDVHVELPPGLKKTPPHFGVKFRKGAVSALQIFSKKGNKLVSDYHGYFNHEKFMKWFKTQLVPALKAMFPDGWSKDPRKKITIYIQLDNASFHTTWTGKRPHLLHMNKDDIVKHLLEHDITSITTKVLDEKSDGVVEKTYAVDRSVLRSVKLSELRLAAAEVLSAPDKAPELLYNDLEHYCADEGIKLIWSPPGAPEFSPIEKVWARIKLFAAVTKKVGRLPLDLMLQLIQALYTTAPADPARNNVRGAGFVMSPGPAAGESAIGMKECEPAAALFASAREKMNEFLGTIDLKRNEAWLWGTVENLGIHEELKAVLPRMTSRDAAICHVSRLVAHKVGIAASREVMDAMDASDNEEDDASADDEDGEEDDEDE
jgi:hypothetical protein